MINVILADDHQIVVDGLVSILAIEKDINVVGTALDGRDVVEILKKQPIDIAILDIEMPGMTGVQLLELINEKYPETKVLILTMYKSQDFVQRIISAGAKGYILKNRGSEELVKAIRYIYSGRSYIGQEITEVLFKALRAKPKKDIVQLIKLTKREKEVLSLVVAGLTSVQISEKLYIAQSTVETHRRNIIDKLGINPKELILFAITNKLV